MPSFQRAWGYMNYDDARRAAEKATTPPP